ncbi:hypothetical protein TOPH_07749 [Tolypocladium ophioglossoides CBS 100239]|uniref:Uncharacterized protein n=1 Tax=Tolypocladium ophioglossoides (strain CBS 100239) TaxID=1163406 RepID=A0A0L0N0S8_TOLOC|nr:hypothetical protein TOPH_07749 [Tolypocladium ophioglossoides CBS 100239]
MWLGLPPLSFSIHGWMEGASRTSGARPMSSAATQSFARPPQVLPLTSRPSTRRHTLNRSESINQAACFALVLPRRNMSAVPSFLSMSQKSSCGNPVVPCRVSRLHASGAATRGRGLAHLVSKFEILDAMSSVDNTVAEAEASVLRGHRKTTLADSKDRLKPSLSVASSKSAVSLASVARSTGNRPGDMPPKRVPSPAASGKSSATKDSTPGAGRLSMVAERRRFFEGGPSDSSLNASKSSPHKQTGYSTKLPLTSSWQTVRTSSPSPSSRSNRTVLQENPSKANVPHRLSQCLPFNKTFPSLLDRQNTKSNSRLLPDASSAATNDDASLERTPEWSSYYSTSSRETRDKPSWLSLKQDKPVPVPKTPVQSQEDSMILPVAATGSAKGIPTGRLMHSSANSGGTIRVRKRQETTPAQPRLGTTGPKPHGSTVPAGFSGSPGSRRLCKKRAKDADEPSEDQPNHSATPAPGKKAPHLQDTIGLFESLSRQATTDRPSSSGNWSSTKQRDAARRQDEPRTQKRGIGLGSTFRKISGSWGRIRLARAMSRKSNTAYTEIDIGRAAGNTPSARFGKNERQTPGRLHEDDSQTNLIDLATLDLIDIEAAMRGSTLPPIGKPFSCPWDGEGSQSDDAQGSHDENIDSGDGEPSNQDSRRKGSQGSTDTETRTAGTARRSSSDHETHEQRRSRRVSSRRWVSRSSGTLVARVQCALEQPRPVRANEVKRLVSLCRDKVTGWKGRGVSE